MTTELTALPSPPLPGDSQGVFNAKAFAFWAAMPQLREEINAAILEILASALAAAQSKDDAQVLLGLSAAAQSNAAASAIDAALNAGATLWTAGTYAQADRTISPSTLRTYRNKTAGVRNTDPAADPANWVDVLAVERVRLTAAANLQVGKLYELDSRTGAFSVTLPAGWADGDWIDLVDVGQALYSNPVTVLRNGSDIRLAAEDLILDVASDSLRLVGRTTLGWIEQ